MECTCITGSVMIVRTFAEASRGANAYRGELLVLRTVHLILLVVNKMWPNLRGRVSMFLDCLGALGRVPYLPPHQIPTQCKHSDVLNNILVNYTDLSLNVQYSHVLAHQDDRETYDTLRRPAQLNCLCGATVKEDVWVWAGE